MLSEKAGALQVGSGWDRRSGWTQTQSEMHIAASILGLFSIGWVHSCDALYEILVPRNPSDHKPVGGDL